MSKNDREDFSESWQLIRRTPPKEYVGRRMKGDKCVVSIIEDTKTRTLPLMRRVRSHSLAFEWGYSGSGPAQLALALLCDYLKDTEKALRLYQAFKFMVVAGLPKEGWRLTEDMIKSYVEKLDLRENQGDPEE
jgi:hypothetical protein